MERNTLPLNLKLDLPMWSKENLTAAKPVLFFNQNGGPNSVTSISTAQKIDQNADFTIKRIETNILKTDKTAIVAADLDKIALLLNEWFLQLFVNQNDRVWYAAMSNLIQYPMLVAAAGASAYDPVHVVNGGTFLNEPVTIKGGEAFQMSLNSDVAASDLTGLRMEVVLWGMLDKTTRARY